MLKERISVINRLNLGNFSLELMILSTNFSPFVEMTPTLNNLSKGNIAKPKYLLK